MEGWLPLQGNSLLKRLLSVMKLLQFIGSIAFLSVIIEPATVLAQGAGSYGRVVQKCVLTISGRTIPFRCRWMYDGVSGGTIFVDNYDTDERFIVESGKWNSTGFIGDGKKACIKSTRGAVACLIK